MQKNAHIHPHTHTAWRVRCLHASKRTSQCSLSLVSVIRCNRGQRSTVLANVLIPFKRQYSNFTWWWIVSTALREAVSEGTFPYVCSYSKGTSPDVCFLWVFTSLILCLPDKRPSTGCQSLTQLLAQFLVSTPSVCGPTVGK